MGVETYSGRRSRWTVMQFPPGIGVYRSFGTMQRQVVAQALNSLRTDGFNNTPAAGGVSRNDDILRRADNRQMHSRFACQRLANLRYRRENAPGTPVDFVRGLPTPAYRRKLATQFM